MTTGYIFLPEQGGGGGTGNILSINGDTSANQIVAAGTGIGVASSGGVTTITNTAGVPVGNDNTFAGFDSTGLLESIPGWGFNPDYMGADVGLVFNPSGAGAFTNIQSFSLNIDPSAASPGDTVAAFSINANIDPDSSGFDLGTDGTLLYAITTDFSHHGTSNIGQLGVINHYADLGNGTDPITVKGVLGYSVFGDYNAGVTFNGGLQGFIFQPVMHTGSAMSGTDSFSQIFSDGLNAPSVAFDGYYSFNSNPNLGSIGANNGFASFQANPTIGALTGNASANMMFVGGIFTGSLGDGTGGAYTGVQVNPAFTNMNANCRGINITPDITAGGADWVAVNISNNVGSTGDVTGIQINGPEASIAINSQGHHTLQSQFTLTSGQGQSYGNIIGGTIIMPDSIAITGTDTIANNFSFGIHTGDGTSTWSEASPVGMSCVGFVGFIDGAGTLNGAVNFCLGGFQDARSGGHIDRINNFNALAIPAGAGTMAEHVLFAGSMPFGLLATSNWGVRIETDSLDNYLPKLAVSTTSQKVTNASCGIELGSTTQAVRLSNLTTTQRLALTPLGGMQVFDTTLAQMAYYNGTTWVIF